MKTVLLSLSLVLAASIASASTTGVVATTQYSDGSTNTWTAGDLQDALGLMNRKYHRDMLSKDGRIAWHGKILQQYLLTNQETKVIYRVDLHADGYAHQYVPKKWEIKDPEEKAKLAQQLAEKRNAIMALWEAANLPPELAALRASQRATSGVTNEVTVVIGGE